MANFHFDAILDPNETIKTVTFMYSNDGIQYYDVCGYTKKHKSLNILKTKNYWTYEGRKRGPI